MSLDSRPMPPRRHSQPADPGNPPEAVSDAADRLKDEAASPVVASATRRLLAGFAATVICLIVLGVLAAIIRRQQLNGLDAAISPFLHGFSSPALDAVMEAATFVGSDPVLIGLLIVVLAVLVIGHRPRRELLFLIVALVGSIALNETLKLVFERARPQFAWAHVPADYSFPSGHSMNSFVFYGSVGLLIWLLAGRQRGLIAIAAALVLVAAIGVSRIYLGFHYFTDVIGGYTAGALWLLIVAGIFEIAPRLRARWWH
jgi:undecaprenyl-diphosphatase